MDTKGGRQTAYFRESPDVYMTKLPVNFNLLKSRPFGIYTALLELNLLTANNATNSDFKLQTVTVQRFYKDALFSDSMIESYSDDQDSSK